MIQPRAHQSYLVELCSGERRHWQYLGPDASTTVWWRDLETGLEFNEASLMYAWQIIAETDDRSS